MNDPQAPKDRIEQIRSRQERGYRLANWNAIDDALRTEVKQLLQDVDNNEFEGLDRLKDTLRERIHLAIHNNNVADASVLKDMFQFVEQEEEEREKAGRDKLTGLPLRRTFAHRFQRSVAHLRRNRHEASHEVPQHLGVMLVDIDHFKSVNDTYGHAAGDAVLKEVSERLRHACREDDLVVRYGGEEFAIILNSTLGFDGAMRAAERFGDSIRSRPISVAAAGQTPKEISVTASFGVITYPTEEFTMEQLSDPKALQERMLNQADLALYAAKEGGRNQAVHYTKELEENA